MKWLALVLALATGCYRANQEQPCDLVCGANGTCPGGLTCNAQNRCTTNASDTCGNPFDDAGPAVDAFVPDGPTGCSAYVPGACVASGDLVLTDPTSTAGCTTVLMPGNGWPVMCLIQANAISVPSHVHMIGPLPLVLAANNLTIDGRLDASSDLLAARVGAGASTSCGPWTVPAQGGGGGAGGTLGTNGGNGGTSGPNSSGGLAKSPNVVSTLSGGCPGEAGSPDVNSGGVAGDGGGAMWLFATNAIMITGSVEACGSGGGGGASGGKGGGGGGGSGGMIVLETAMLSWQGANLVANGGGGGGGAVPAMAGGAGDDGGITTAGAPGGKGFVDSSTGAVGGSGGLGGFGDGLGGNADGGLLGGGGGGGGGGQGILVVHARTTVGTASTSPSAH